MKCDNCKENEAQFHFITRVDGEPVETHLCGDCAAEAGLLESGSRAPQNAGDMFIAFPLGAPGAISLPGLGQGMAVPVMAMPFFGIHVFGDIPSWDEAGNTSDNGAANGRKVDFVPTATKQEVFIPEDAGAEFRGRRELNSLKNRLCAAVKAEDFENAALLRDQIREMEG
jgi:protein arginine kinase activator